MHNHQILQLFVIYEIILMIGMQIMLFYTLHRD